MMARQEMIFARSCFRRLVLIALIARTRAEVEFSCAPSLIANSNRSVTSSACTGSDGDECLFACNVGFVHVGRHVCQTIRVQGATVVNQTFFGGRCDPLCEPATPCNDSAAPVRYRANASAPWSWEPYFESNPAFAGRLRWVKQVACGLARRASACSYLMGRPWPKGRELVLPGPGTLV